MYNYRNFTRWNSFPFTFFTFLLVRTCYNRTKNVQSTFARRFCVAFLRHSSFAKACACNVVNLSLTALNRYYPFSCFYAILYLLFIVAKCSFYNYYCIYADLYLGYVHIYDWAVFVNVSFYNILLFSLILLPVLLV